MNLDYIQTNRQTGSPSLTTTWPVCHRAGRCAAEVHWTPRLTNWETGLWTSQVTLVVWLSAPLREIFVVGIWKRECLVHSAKWIKHLTECFLPSYATFILVNAPALFVWLSFVRSGWFILLFIKYFIYIISIIHPVTQFSYARRYHLYHVSEYTDSVIALIGLFRQFAS